jgi:predicted nucleic acid-binding protein
VTVHLLDANVLISLTVREHEHHLRASTWVASAGAVALTPVVEGALVRFLLRVGEDGRTARALLLAARDHPRVEFWPDDLSYADVDLEGLVGHRTVTDTYLAALAGSRDARLATLDVALNRRLPDLTTLLP